MSAMHTVRSVISHRGMSGLDLHRLLGEQDKELRVLRPRAEKTTALEARLDEQANTITSLTDQLGDATRRRDTVNAKAERYDEAEARAKAAEGQLAAMQAELRELRAFKANATAISDLPQNVSTQPVPVLPLHQSPMAAVTDPGLPRQTTWGRDTDTQPLPKAAPAA